MPSRIIISSLLCSDAFVSDGGRVPRVRGYFSEFTSNDEQV
jgi:hypothetical protein